MWKAQLLKPITSTSSNIPVKPKREDCCQEAKNKWKIHMIRDADIPESYVREFKKGLDYEFLIDNDKHCLDFYDLLDRNRVVTGYSNKSCDEFRKMLVGYYIGCPVASKILKEWKKCEGK